MIAVSVIPFLCKGFFHIHKYYPEFLILFMDYIILLPVPGPDIECMTLKYYCMMLYSD